MANKSLVCIGVIDILLFKNQGAVYFFHIPNSDYDAAF